MLERMAASEWDDYDPKRDRALLGSWTDELTKRIPARTQNAAVMAIDSAINAAAADDDTVFSKLLAQSRGKAMDSIEAIIEWAVDEGSPIAAPAPTLAATILRGLPASLTARAPSEIPSLDPELSERQPLNPEDLAMFEVPPEGLTPEQFEEERYQRKERKGQAPLRYPPLTEKDLGADGDLDKIYRAIDFFLGRRRLEVAGKPVTKTFPARSARIPEDQKRDIIGRLLGTVRDNKIKAWKEAVRKRDAGDTLSAAEARHAKFFGPSPLKDSGEAQILGRKKSHFDNMILNLMRKSPVEERGGRFIQHEEKATAKPYTDIPTGSASRGVALRSTMKRLVEYLGKAAKEPVEYETEEGGRKVKKTGEHDLAKSLRNLGRYIEEGGAGFDTKQYDALAKRFKAEVDALGLKPGELSAVYLLFPEHVTTSSGEGDGEAKTKMFSLDEALDRAMERHREAQQSLDVARNKLSRTQEDVDAARPVVDRVNSLSRSAKDAYSEANAISPDLAPKARALFKSAQNVKVESGEKPTDMPEKRRKSVARAADTFVENTKAGYGDDARKVADLVAKSVNEEAESEDLLSAAKKEHGDAVPLIVAETSAKSQKEDLRKIVEGLQSLADRPESQLQGVFSSGNDLLKSIEETVRGQRGKTSFEEIPVLTERLNDVLKALRAIKGAAKAREIWDFGGARKYMQKPEQESEGEEDGEKSYYGDLITLTKPGKAEGEPSDKAPRSPQDIIKGILGHDIIDFLLKKSEQMSLGSKGRPEAVKGPSFRDLDDVMKVFEDAISLLKRYDPKTIEKKLMQTALSKMSVGAQIASLVQRQERQRKMREKRKVEKAKPKMEAERTKERIPAPEPEAKPQEKLSSMLHSFMAKVAAIRTALLGRSKEAVPKSKIDWGYFTKREKKTGPVYFEPFFIDPDDVDEFVHALGREGFNFMESVVESGERGAIPKERAEAEEPTGKEPPRGYKLKINDIIAKTMLKGAASLEDYVLSNKDRMAAVLGGRLDEDRRRLKEAKSELARIDDELRNPELTGEEEFLTQLAGIINNPESAAGEAAKGAFPAKVRGTRAKTLRAIQKDLGNVLEKVKRYDEFKRRRDELARRYKDQGVDPEAREDYRYADEVVRDVDYIKEHVGLDALRWIQENVPNYDKMRSQLEGLRAIRSELDEGQMQTLEDLKNGVAYLERYLSKNPKYQRLERTHPFESRRERDVPTEKAYEEVKRLPEEEKREIRRTREERAKQLSELENFEDWKDWIRKIEKPLYPEAAKDISVDLARERLALKALRKAADAADAKAKAAPEGDARKKADREAESKRADVTKAEARVAELEKKLATMRARKTELGDIRPGEHEPKAITRAWNDFNENVEAAILGKKKLIPKFLADFVNSADLARASNDELVKMLRGIERRLESEQAEDRVIPARSLASDEEWEATKKKAIDGLEERKRQARGILEEAKKARTALKSSNLTDDERQEAAAGISEMQSRITNLRANAQTATEIIKRLEQMRGTQKAIRGEAEEDLKRQAGEFLKKAIPEAAIPKDEITKALDEIIDQPDVVRKGARGPEIDGKAVATALQRAIDLTSSDEGLLAYAREGERILKAMEGHPSKEDPSLQEAAANVRAKIEEARKSRDITPISYAQSRLAGKLHDALSEAAPKGLPPDEAERAAKAVTEKVDTFRKTFQSRASEVIRKANLPEDWIKKELKREEPLQERSRTIKYLDLNPPIKNTFLPMVKALKSGAEKMESEGSAKGAQFMAHLQSARDATSRYLDQLKYMSELADNALRFTQPGGKVTEQDAKKARDRLDRDYSVVKEGWKALTGHDWEPFWQQSAAALETSVFSDGLAKMAAATSGQSKADQASSRSWLDGHRRDLKKILDLARVVYKKMGGKTKKEAPLPTGRATVNIPEESDPFWRKKAADPDFDPTNIENWLSSAPRQYLEDLPKIPMDDWDIIEALYGQRMAEYKDLVRGNQMVLDSDADKAKLKKLMIEAQRRAARLEALKDATATVGTERVRIADAGNVFNRRLSRYLARKNALLMKRRALLESMQRFQHSVDTAEGFVESDEGKAPEMKKPLSKKEMQSITDQFYRGLFWYLQDYWKKPVGKERVFGGMESPEFSQLYDTMKALSGVRSNPLIQRVIIAGNKARRELREVQENIRRRKAGLKRLGIDPDEMLDKYEEKYGKRAAKKEEAEAELKSEKDPGYRLGFSLYLLTRMRDQLLAQIRQKRAMNGLLSETADLEYKKKVLESIASKTADPSLKRQIQDRMDGMEGELKEEIESKAKAAEKDAKEVSIEAERMRGEIPEEVFEAPQAGIEKEPATQEAKEANYRDDPNFDLALLYGDVMQSTIASFIERTLRRGSYVG